MGGEHDVVKAALAGHAEVAFRKVAIQPGMPQGFGVVGRSRTRCSPCREPGSARSCPSMLSGLRWPPAEGRDRHHRRSPLVLTASVTSPAHRRSYLRGVLDPAAGTVTPLSRQFSHQLGALAQANALIVVPEQVTALAAGETADVTPLP